MRILTDHLGHHVGRADGHRGDRGGGADGDCPHPVGKSVRHRVLAGVAHRLGDHEEHDQVRDQPPDRVHETVVAVEGDQAGDAEE
jgi:hypothetical protein